MKRFSNILRNKATIGNLFTLIASFIFAVLVRYIYNYLFDYIPVKGELEMLDLTYFGIVVIFRCLFGAYLEYLLDDRFSVPLFAGNVKEPADRGMVILKMVDKDPQQSSTGNLPQASNTRSASIERLAKMISEEADRRNTGNSAMDKHFDIGAKMWDVLMEQEKKLLRLNEIRISKHVEFYEEDGGLELTVPVTMQDSEAKALSKEIGAIDRSLQNKFSEYNNLKNKAAKFPDPDWADTYKECFNNNQKLYKELFENKKK